MHIAYTHRYCKTSFQYISLGISPLRLFWARSLESIFQESRMSIIEPKISVMGRRNGKYNNDLQNLQIRNLRQSWRNWSNQLVVLQNPEIQITIYTEKLVITSSKDQNFQLWRNTNKNSQILHLFQLRNRKWYIPSNFIKW